MGGTRAERARDAEMGWEGGVGRWMALTFPREASHPRERSEPALGWPNASEASQTWGGWAGDGGQLLFSRLHVLLYLSRSEPAMEWEGWEDGGQRDGGEGLDWTPARVLPRTRSRTLTALSLP